MSNVRCPIFKASLQLPVLSLLLFLLHACNTPEPGSHAPQRAFYHWQTGLSLDSIEQQWMHELNAKKLYVKFFDVDWQGEAVPLAQVKIDTTGLDSVEVIPTVFITNRTMEQLPAEGVEELAERIERKIIQLAGDLPTTGPLREVQLDCDWTPGTRERFFALLTHLRVQFGEQVEKLSATIRLHQVRYFEETGVPPVDRGMLMFYNMGELESWEDNQSILNLDAAQAYMDRGIMDYPLPLDIALPVFRWGVLFRDGRMIKLINQLDEQDLQDSTRFERLTPGRFRVKKSTYLNGYYLYANDLLKLEKVAYPQLEAAAAYLNSFFGVQPYTLAYYHLDTEVLNYYTYEQLEKILQ